MVSVYDDRIEIVRRDFRSDCDLGPNWVMPLPAAESKPFAFAERARHFEAPQFPAGAAAKVEWEKREVAEKGKNGKETKRTLDVVKLSVPAAAQTFENRVWRYEVVAETAADGREAFRRHVLSPDYYLPLGKVSGDFVFVAPKDDLPKGADFRFRVVPYNCFGKAGRPLVTETLKA